MIKTKGNEDLFNQWQVTGETVKLLSSIVQNDMELSRKDILNFTRQCNEIIEDIKKLKERTVKHLLKES